MARADLHDALVIDHEIYEASRVDPTLLDPVVRISGGLPGPAKAFKVVRAYQGPQGAYSERFTITDRAGREVARSHARRAELRGEMFEDRFTSLLRDVRLHDGDEHTAHFFINDVEVGSIPVFVEAADGGDARVAAQETFGKALQKGSVLWVGVPQPAQRKRPARVHTQPVWFVFADGKVYVLDGDSEQQVPGLRQASEVQLTARSKDLRSAVSQVQATARVVDHSEPLWEEIARTGLGRRLNLPDGDAALDRWKERCELVELTPLFRPAEDADTPETTGAEAAEGAEAADTSGDQAAGPRKKKDEDIHVEAQIDQEVFDKLIADGKSERIARAKAKAAYVRAEKARIRAEREAAGDDDAAEGQPAAS